METRTMSNYLATRTSSADLSGVRISASPIDHALTLFLADETEAALRWGAAALERDPLSPAALAVTSRLLDQMGRTRAAIDGLRLSVRRAIDTGNLPLAVAAIDDLRILGADVTDQLDQVARAFCRGSVRLQLPEQSMWPAPPQSDFLEPLSPFLAGPPLASRATQIVQAAKQAHDTAVGAELPPLAPLPLFSALSRDALREFLGAFQMITVPAGHRVIQEGEEGDAAYIIAQGEVEISRRASHGENKPWLGLASLGNGAFFGEMALLSQLPGATSATTTRPTILLVGKRDQLVAVAARRPEVAVQLAAHCRRNSLENLGWTSPVVAAIPSSERAALVERLQMRVFDRGERLVRDREEAKGLHLIVSGEVAIVAREWSERVLLATLGAGETVGEVELVLCRQSYADAIAVRPTAALFLSREEYSVLVQDRPAVLHGLYATAVRRHAETRLALEAGSAAVADEWLLEEDEEQTATRVIGEGSPHPRVPSSPPNLPPPRTSARPPPVPTPVPPAAHFASESPKPEGVSPVPSILPMSASIQPPPVAAPTQRVFPGLAMAAGAVLIASAAGIVAVFALAEGRREGRDTGAAAAATGAVVRTETSGTTATPPSQPLPETAAAAGATGATGSATPARPVFKRPVFVRPRVVMAGPASAAPVTPAVAVASASASSASSAPAPAASTPAPGPRLTSATSGADDFGGRE